MNDKIVLGLMRLEDVSVERLEAIIGHCLEVGIRSYDLSDVYGSHESERKFGEVMKRHPEWREKMFIQTKCGILKPADGNMYMDLSYDHIIESCYGSLERMNIAYLDCYLLHRVDIFMDAEEINRAFNRLKSEGKVLAFGCSNMDVQIMEYLRENLDEKLILNQLQLGLGECALISQCFNVNASEQKTNLQDGIYFYLKRKGIRLQCWSPLIYKFFKGSIFKVPELEETRKCLTELAEKYRTTPAAIAISFDASLGEDVQVLIGSMNEKHIDEALEGSKIQLSRQDWYKLYLSTGNLLP